MKQKLLFLVLSVFFVNSLLIINGCNKCNPGGGATLYYNILDVEAVNHKVNSSYGNLEEELPDQSIVSYDEFGIQLVPDKEYAFQQKSDWQMEGLLINSAMACTPIPNYEIGAEKIDSISVFSNADFELDGHIVRAGKNLNDLFTINSYDTGEQQLILFNNETDEEIKSVNSIDFVLRLIVAPISYQMHQFTIHYTHTNGDQYITMTNSVELKP